MDDSLPDNRESSMTFSSNYMEEKQNYDIYTFENGSSWHEGNARVGDGLNHPVIPHQGAVKSHDK